MKKLFYLLVLFLALIMPSKVYAVIRGELLLECDSYTKQVGEYISCTLYANADEGISAVETTLKNDDRLTLSNIVVPSIWQGDYENKTLLLYTDVNKPLKSEILRFNVTSSIEGTYSFTFKDTYFSDSSFNRTLIANPNYTFKFIKEETKPEEDPTIAIIVDDNNQNPTVNENKIVESEDNPGTGAFISVSLLVVLSILGVVLYFKTRKKKLYRL